MMNRLFSFLDKMSRRERACYIVLFIDFIFGLIGAFHPHVSFSDLTAYIVTVNAFGASYITGESMRQSNIDTRNPPTT